jgi:aspartyl-tRNA(Asn)/glutamyl-tRNA(Gln) amidotransferase subunit A
MEKSTPLYSHTIESAAAGLASGEFTSLELTNACLDRIADLDGSVHAFVRVDADLARKHAVGSDERRAAGKTLGVLDGIPYNLKDVYATSDSPTTSSSHMLENWLAPYDATVYRLLCQAGAVMLGKTNTDEFTMGVSTETSYFGVTRNPWDYKRVSGGSSGGPAASMAAHFGMFSVGTDTGGSIRQPAAFCGVVGLRPTYGRISRFGELAMASSLDQTGPVTKTVRDAAIVLEALAGHDPLDATSSPEPVQHYAKTVGEFLSHDRPLSGLRVGVAKEYFGPGLDPEVEKATREALVVLEGLGATMVEVSLPNMEHALAAYYIIAPAEVASNMARYDGIHFGYSVERSPGETTSRTLYDVYASSRAQGFGSEVKRRIMLGTHVLSSGYYDEYYAKAEKVRALVAQEFAHVFTQVDVLAAPVSVHTAFKVGDKINDPLSLYKEDLLTVPLNIAGIPGMSVPCGLVNGLPVGLQLMTDRFDEATLLNVGAAFEQATSHHLLQPTLLT